MSVPGTAHRMGTCWSEIRPKVSKPSEESAAEASRVCGGAGDRIQRLSATSLCCVHRLLPVYRPREILGAGGASNRLAILVSPTVFWIAPGCPNRRGWPVLGPVSTASKLSRHRARRYTGSLRPMRSKLSRLLRLPRCCACCQTLQPRLPTFSQG